MLFGLNTDLAVDCAVNREILEISNKYSIENCTTKKKTIRRTYCRK